MPRHLDDDGFEEAEESEAAENRALETACPECGASLDPMADICPKCGMWVDGESLRVGNRRTRAMRYVSLIVVLLLILALTLPALRWL